MIDEEMKRKIELTLQEELPQKIKNIILKKYQNEYINFDEQECPYMYKNLIYKLADWMYSEGKPGGVSEDRCFDFVEELVNEYKNSITNSIFNLGNERCNYTMEESSTVIREISQQKLDLSNSDNLDEQFNELYSAITSNLYNLFSNEGFMPNEALYLIEDDMCGECKRWSYGAVEKGYDRYADDMAAASVNILRNFEDEITEECVKMGRKINSGCIEEIEEEMKNTFRICLDEVQKYISENKIEENEKEKLIQNISEKAKELEEKKNSLEEMNTMFHEEQVEDGNKIEDLPSDVLI